MNKTKPVRTCVVCRKQSDKGDLIRVVRTTEGAIEVDVKGKKPGRGAYVCLTSDCIGQLSKGNRLSRALRCQVSDTIVGELQELLPEAES